MGAADALVLGYCSAVFVVALAFWGWVGWTWLKFEWRERHGRQKCTY